MVAEGPGWGVVSEPREDGIGGNGFRPALRDKDLALTAEAKESFNLSDDPLSRQMIGVEGTEGNTNTFYGLDAGNGTMSGMSNSFFGRYAGNFNTTGYSNTFMGRAAGRKNTSGYENTFLGYQAGNANTSGHCNVFVGSSAGIANVTGYGNAFFGNDAGGANTEDWNTFIGAYAGLAMTTGRENTFIGDYAGSGNDGNNNVFVGNEAGSGSLSGSGNVFVGNEAGTTEMGSNKLYIDNSYTAGPLIYGDFGTNILKFNGNVGIKKTPTHILDVGTSGAYCNGGAWVDGSSREYKENVKALTSAEAQQAFEKLEPVKFNYKENKGEIYLGFIAEDVPDLVAMNDRKGLNAMDMVAMLTKIVQEQQKALLEQRKFITELREEIAQIREEGHKESK